MGQSTAQIERSMQLQREQLGRDIHDLRSRIRDTKDWRKQFDKRPGVILAVAFGAGVVVSMVTRKGVTTNGHSRTRNLTEAAWARPAVRTWDSIKGALIGVAVGRIKELVGAAVPGFEDEFRKCETESATSSVHRL